MIDLSSSQSGWDERWVNWEERSMKRREEECQAIWTEPVQRTHGPSDAELRNTQARYPAKNEWQLTEIINGKGRM